MEKTRPILYGVADYAQIRKKNETDELVKIFHASVMTARKNLAREEMR